MKVRFLNQYGDKFAVIHHDLGQLNVRLRHGVEARQALLDQAAELEADAKRLLRRAELCKGAAYEL